MQKIILFLMISLGLIAAEINMKEFKKKYLLGVEIFKKKEYKKSLEIFDELFEIKSDEPDVNFYMGRAAFELKDYEGALIAYDRVLISSPDSLRTQLEVARTYFMLKSYDRSKKAFKEILAMKVPKAVEANVKNYLDVITKAQQKHIITGVAMFGASNEFNLNNIPDGGKQPFLGIPSTDVKQNDRATQQIALLNHKYIKSDDITYKNDLLIFNKAYKKHKNNDILLVSYTPTYSKVYSEKLTLDYSLFYDYLKYDHSHLMDSYGIFPKATYVIDEKNTLKVSYKLTRKNNKNNTNSDSNTHQLSVDLVKVLDKKNSITPSFKYTVEKKLNVSNTIDYEAYKLGLSHNYTYAKNIFLSSAASYEVKDYEDTNKKNIKKDFTLSASYLTKNIWIVQGAFTHTDQTSNLHDEKYDKDTFGINFIKPF